MQTRSAETDLDIVSVIAVQDLASRPIVAFNFEHLALLHCSECRYVRTISALTLQSPTASD